MFFRIYHSGPVFLIIAIVSIASLIGVAGGLSGTGHAAGVPQSFTDLARESSPAVVNISTMQSPDEEGEGFRHFFQRPGQQREEMPLDEFLERFFGRQDPRQFQRRSLGSGFILDETGYIVTNNHVIENADEITVKLKNGDEYDAAIIGTDPSTDIALIKIDAETDLPTLELGDSEKLDIGQWVLAIGNPFGLDHTVTAGIVSAKGRVIGAGAYDDFIQTDASINPGNSGGPLIDMEGRVVGINTAIVAGGDGIGFAIPISMAEAVIAQLRETGEVTRGWIGVAIQELTRELKEYYDAPEGVLITDVFSGDPADEAGIEPGDIIVAVNGEKVESPGELSRKIADIMPGEDVVLSVIRDGEEKEITATVAKRDETRLGERPREQPEEDPAKDELGLEVVDIDRETAEQLGMDDAEGVIVVGVAPDTRASDAGFSRGDIIREINRQPVNSTDDYRKIVSNAEEGDVLSFYVIRPREGIMIIRVEM